MKPRPILFSAPMVRALLDGRKTQTRRVVKVPATTPKPSLHNWQIVDSGQVLKVGECPYGKPGDLLWVREKWSVAKSIEGAVLATRDQQWVAYAEDVRLPAGRDYSWAIESGSRWRPSIHMPRWASRLTLEITGVRVQRLQDIRNDDAVAEGTYGIFGEGFEAADPVKKFATLWCNINGARSWSENPWVWALTFIVHKQNVDQLLQARAS